MAATGPRWRALTWTGKIAANLCTNGRFNRMKLHRLDAIPDALLDCPATELYRYLPGPTLIHLPGARPEPVFTSVLLHGNETTGWRAVQRLLIKHNEQALPRALTIFIGNIEAARYGMRRLDDQIDYNRVWSHEGYFVEGPEAAIMREVVNEMRERRAFVSIDIHNNTGINPHYACINRRHDDFYHLALLFSRTVIYFTNPKGVQSQAFAEICPAVTVECGQVGHELGIQHAHDYLEAALGLSTLPSHAVLAQDIDLFHTVAIVKIPESVEFSFSKRQAPLHFVPELDKMNFSELSKGTTVAQLHWDQPGLPVQALDDDGADHAERFFYIEEGELRTRSHVMPSMLTLDEDIIRKDCLCYLMERMTL
jgi:succinylglutamate desuccinylase